MMVADSSLLEFLPSGWPGLALLAWAVVSCFLGYFVFRALNVLHGAMAALAGGALAIAALTPGAGTLDFVVGCSGLAIVGALLGWFFYRPVFAVVAAVGFGAGVIVLLGGGRPTAGVWMAGILAGLALGGICYAYLHRMIILLYGLAGGAGIAVLTFRIIGPHELSRPVLAAVLAIFTVALSVAGMACQVRLVKLFTDALTPGARRRKLASKPGRTVHPRFTRL